MSTLGFLFLLSYVLLGNVLAQPYLTPADKENFKNIFDTGLSKGFHDVQSVALSVRGYSLLDLTLNNEKEACNLFQTTFANTKNIDDLFASARGAYFLKSKKCDLDATKLKAVLGDIDKITTIENLFKTVIILKTLKLEIDSASVKSLLENFLKKDSSAINQAYGYFIMSYIFKIKTDLKKYFVEIEDTIQQADEADHAYMYYEDGTFTTSFILNSIFELVEKYEESPPISTDKIQKFANFLLARRYTYQLKIAVELLSAIKSLSINKFKIPLVISMVDNGIVTMTNNLKVKISVTNLWGDKISDAKVIAETVKNVQSAATVITRRSCELSSGPLGTHELDLTTQEQLIKGFYSIKFDVKVNETRFNEGVSSTLLAKVVSNIHVDNVELSIKERDQITGMLNYKLTMGNLLADKLSMNWHHRLDMKFVIRDSNQNSFRPHQVFIKLTHSITKQEIIFIVEPDRSDVYKFTLDLEKSSKDFDNLSGDYEMKLILGDAVINTPDNWIFANIKLEMPSNPSTENTGESRKSVAGTKRSLANPRIGKGPSIAKPQIFHMFKPAEKRGGQLISTVFTILCTVLPFAIMLVLWGFLSINVSNFQFALSPLLFHMGLIAIFGLYYCYWSYLNMFTTLQYLIPLGGFTAFFGNRVLRQIASKRKDA